MDTPTLDCWTQHVTSEASLARRLYTAPMCDGALYSTAAATKYPAATAPSAASPAATAAAA